MCCTWGFTPGPWRVFPFLRFQSQIPRTTSATRAATPLMVPPIIAPVFCLLSSPLVSGAEAADEAELSESVDEGSAVPEVALAVSVSVSVSDAVEVSDSVDEVSDCVVDSAVDSVVESVFDSFEDVSVVFVVDDFVFVEDIVFVEESDVVFLLVPNVVGSASEVAEAVKTYGFTSVCGPLSASTQFVNTPCVQDPALGQHPTAPWSASTTQCEPAEQVAGSPGSPPM
ncbi:hypothetical protein HG530_009999 [Fusarium avenaceum]|nr:hypothetical protein HG530_009999 [Fusarium avenaceum]